MNAAVQKASQYAAAVLDEPRNGKRHSAGMVSTSAAQAVKNVRWSSTLFASPTSGDITRFLSCFGGGGASEKICACRVARAAMKALAKTSTRQTAARRNGRIPSISGRVRTGAKSYPQFRHLSTHR